MRESIGSVFFYNVIIIFILIVFAFIVGTMSYYKAFRVNTLIINSLEKFQGYNDYSSEEIKTNLRTMGYNVSSKRDCPRKDGVNAFYSEGGFCLYEFREERNFRSYGVISYIQIELPILSEVLQIPIFSKTIKMYNF